MSTKHKNREVQPLTESGFYILLSLTKPLHGYGIMQNVNELSSGRVNLAAGTLYGALSVMVDKGWIRGLPTKASSRKREYIISDKGWEILRQEILRLEELLDSAKQVLGGGKQS